MAKYRNCPNCGAPYNLDTYRCPYCSTLYYDMSAIDMDNHEPFFMKIRSNGMIITQLVAPVKADVSLTQDDYYMEEDGKKIAKITQSRNLDIDIRFQGVVRPGDNVLMEVIHV